MRKIFTFLCAALMSAGMFATTVVTITDSDFPAWGESCTKDGVTVSAGSIDGMYGNISGPGSFSTTLGNFTQIEVSAASISVSGDGWSGDSEHKTWTGNASSVSFIGDINGYEEGTTLKFTIEESAPAEVTVVFAANDKTVERTVTLPHTFKCDWAGGMERPDELDIIIHELYNDYYYCNSNMNASGSDQVEAGTEEDPKNDYITIKGVFEGTATVTGDYLDYVAGDYGEHNYSITISIKGDEPQPQETVVTITEADYVSGNTITKDGVTLTVNQIYGVGSWYLVGPGTFTNTIGNFTKIEVTTVGGTVFIEGDGWTGDFDKMTWTGNAPSVSFVDDIMGKGQGFSIVCTIAAGEPEPAGKPIVVFEANGKKKEVEVELPHTFWCDLGSENGELDLIIQELYALPQGGYCDYYYDGPVATGNPAVTAGADDDANHFITISEAFEGTATVSGKYNKYTEMDEEDFTYTLTISIKDTPTAVENVQTNHVQGTKILRDGMLLIERDGKIFNVTGAQVR